MAAPIRGGATSDIARLAKGERWVGDFVCRQPAVWNQTTVLSLVGIAIPHKSTFGLIMTRVLVRRLAFLASLLPQFHIFHFFAAFTLQTFADQGHVFGVSPLFAVFFGCQVVGQEMPAGKQLE